MLLNIWKYGQEVDKAYYIIIFESITCSLILTIYLDVSNRTDFLSNYWKIQVSMTFKNVLEKLSEGVIVQEYINNQLKETFINEKASQNFSPVQEIYIKVP